MYALRERRQHVTHEDFEFAVAKVSWANDILVFVPDANISVGTEKEPRRQYFRQQALLVDHHTLYFIASYPFLFLSRRLVLCQFQIVSSLKNL